MNDWEAKLDQLLSNPDAMSQVMNLAQSLSAQMGSETAVPPPPPQGSGSASDLLGGIDPELIARLLPVLKQMNRTESTESSAFLYALRPFLKESRRDKVDRAVQLARVIHLAKTFLTSEGGLGHV